MYANYAAHPCRLGFSRGTGQYAENTRPPDYWLWRAGMPMPIQSVVSAQKNGATRACRFSGNVQFDEKITEFTLNRVLTFDVTRPPQNPEILGHFSSDKGQLRLKRNKDGSTTVIATSWYRLFVRPAFYCDWWAGDIIRHVHFRVSIISKRWPSATQRSKLPCRYAKLLRQ